MNEDFIAKLQRARRLIEGGWIQNNFYLKGCFCLVGALSEAGLGGAYWFQMPDGSAGGPISWNDTKGRTQADVLACIDNSIAALEQSQ